MPGKDLRHLASLRHGRGIAIAMEALSHRHHSVRFSRFDPSLLKEFADMSHAAADSAANANGQFSQDTPAELQEMAAAIDSLPARYREIVAPALGRVVECSTRRRRILNLVQEALSQLRLDMKYLIFDLEATRRERDQYKEMLEQDGRL